MRSMKPKPRSVLLGAASFSASFPPVALSSSDASQPYRRWIEAHWPVAVMIT